MERPSSRRGRIGLLTEAVAESREDRRRRLLREYYEPWPGETDAETAERCITGVTAVRFAGERPRR